ncbi:MAG: hypothetical protein ABIP71_14420, partial [Verrucomicrobiota bacterium]
VIRFGAPSHFVSFRAVIPPLHYSLSIRRHNGRSLDVMESTIMENQWRGLVSPSLPETVG